MPRAAFPWRRDASGATVSAGQLAAWLATDERIAVLRAAGRWGDQHDRAAKLTPWLRAAEHSAQQSSSTQSAARRACRRRT
jgi:hypothetical protein